MSDQVPLDFADGPLAFADGKDAGAFRTIGEVAVAFGIRQHVLRYWEEQFPMLKPLKRAGGRRYYRPEDVRLIGEINRLLYAEGFTIRGARQALGGKGERVEHVSAVPDSGVRAKLSAVRDGLAGALQKV